jgi:hypothetical protein
MVRNKQYGYMVGYINGSFTETKLEDCIDNLKKVNPDGNFVRRARELGVSFGD